MDSVWSILDWIVNELKCGLLYVFAGAAMSIAEELSPILVSRFGAMNLRVDSPPKALATFACVCEAVGDVLVYDGGDEATIYLGNFTHYHFEAKGGAAETQSDFKEVAGSVIPEFNSEVQHLAA
jgi:hypothetical protein